MPTYRKVITQIHQLSKAEQLQLLEELKAIVDKYEVNGEAELIDATELNTSEASWQDYLAGHDHGKSLQEVELELFGRELD